MKPCAILYVNKTVFSNEPANNAMLVSCLSTAVIDTCEAKLLHRVYEQNSDSFSQPFTSSNLKFFECHRLP